ncbi:MAG: DNA cytosine methyltransferase [Dehalococcoidia bacterium]|nr:DNA cytosine methyltransferase [Dehalococcoidia bacterium]
MAGRSRSRFVLPLERAGFEFSFCIDNDRSAVSALRENQHAGVMLQDADVRCADALTFDFRALARADVALLAGGASCQPFSVGGLGKGPRDARDTFPAVFRAPESAAAEDGILENVREGFSDRLFRSYFERLSGQPRCPFGTGPIAKTRAAERNADADRCDKRRTTTCRSRRSMLRTSAYRKSGTGYS